MADGEAPEAMQRLFDSNPETAREAQTYQCHGCVYCSRMTSRAAAEFFIKHCPGTKMDGDNDGEPCESDSRFQDIAGIPTATADFLDWSLAVYLTARRDPH
jgi:Excalibur calcium-binding domain